MGHFRKYFRYGSKPDLSTSMKSLPLSLLKPDSEIGGPDFVL
jgi:hypothetical protein